MCYVFSHIFGIYLRRFLFIHSHLKRNIYDLNLIINYRNSHKCFSIDDHACAYIQVCTLKFIVCERILHSILTILILPHILRIEGNKFKFSHTLLFSFFYHTSVPFL